MCRGLCDDGICWGVVLRAVSVGAWPGTRSGIPPVTAHAARAELELRAVRLSARKTNTVVTVGATALREL